MNPFIAAMAGAMMVAGLIGMVVACLPAPPRPPQPPWPARPGSRPSGRRLALPWSGVSVRTRRLLLVGTVAGLVIALVSGWVIAIALVPAAVAGIPVLLTPPASGEQVEKLEALEEWARSLSGKLTAGQSLRSALIRSLRSAPAPIEREVGLLVSRLWDNSTSTEDVLRLFAEDINDSTGDVVVTNLILAASGRGQVGLSVALEALAETVAADVRARRQIAADQAKPRTTARTVTAITLAVLGVLSLTGTYIAPYGTPVGQIVLGLLLSAYVATLMWLRRMAVLPPLPRFLNLTARQAARNGAGNGAGTWAASTAGSGDRL
ncbi:type II secretion system F family protein [Nocardioides okcheonensis]|uniref:type II secretion system F family protein n=1 Tax=Nocardioides okcheonensis TaxID=2894081 RepID=UPI001E3E5B60|nr:type II secretion system F family protein [Nocardioides okcheonensis]UFN45211.1 type II secretion system F family protein [Nocardioides okcheonensis]